MKPAELRELSSDELETKLKELIEEQFRLRFRSATEAIENPMRFRAIRRDIARINTVLRERAGQVQG
ncbi:MAG TPA: 50S ribosomal protein L29 [Gemmatimonadales bacterium]|nr:50S ribosomal protein L29 [Gemmatimonadales bacterium]